ncbi:hypothetical protein CKO15_08490 [Halorhodospira abdelmalekii]|uniref:beta strand repeat-containing protein n=1 Tax=Halorhodospira abdelmalekii TaxID=421629 RepID=UPI0019079AAA|nr:hypothetical protein [Halorhodospira abdelmalekii]MBK1735320.1 hypothetical protein [Halorhodospira abdelmalekii]
MSSEKANDLITQLNDLLDLGIEADTPDGAAMRARILQEWDRGATIDVIDLVTYFNRFSPSYRDADEGERQQMRDDVGQFIEDNPGLVEAPDVDVPDVPGVPGETFTLTASTDAILTDSFSQNVNPDDKYLSNADDEINALNYLRSSTYIEDPSTTDNDVLKANIGTSVTITPTLINIETLELRSINNGADVSFGGIEGTNLVTVTGTPAMELSSFVQDGSVEARLAANNDLTITGADNGTTDDVFNLSVEGSTGTSGRINLDSAGTAVAIGTVNLESRGTAENIMRLDSATGDYTGITDLNLSGSAALKLTTDYAVASNIDATDLDGDLTITLVGAGVTGSFDMGDVLTGDFKEISLQAYDAAAVVDFTDISGLETVNAIAANADGTANANNITLDIAKDVEVGLQAGDGNNDVVIRVDGAGAVGSDNDSLIVNIGGAIQAETNNLTIADVQNITFNSTTTATGDITNALTNTVTTGALEHLTVNATTAGFSSTGFTMAAGSATKTVSETFAITTTGDEDIALGTLTTGANINKITLDNSGEGDRSLSITAGDLKAVESSTQAAGEGVVVTGEGTGDVVITDDATNGTIITEMIINGDDYAGDTYVATATGNIDADNYTGVNGIILTGIYNDTISNLGADTTVISTANATAITIENKTGVTSQDVLLKMAANGAWTANLTANSVKTLNITTDDENQTGNSAHTVTTLAATNLETLNIEAAEEASFVLDNTYTTRVGEAGDRNFAINLSGEGAITFDDGITSGAGIDTITIDASGTGTRSLGALTTSDMSNGGNLTITGDQDVAITDIIDTGATAQKLNLLSDANITIGDVNVPIAAASTYTINSSSTDGEGTNQITDASNIDFTASGDNSITSSLKIIGNQDFVLGQGGDEIDFLTGAGEAHQNALDASEFTGELTAFIARGTGDAESSFVEILVGTGDATFNLNNATTGANQDIMKYIFSEDGIGEVEITNFSVDDSLDQLDFSAFFTGTVAQSGMTGTSAGSTGYITADGDNVLKVELGAGGTDAYITAVNGEFEGSIKLTGIGDLASFENGNFDFA